MLVAVLSFLCLLGEDNVFLDPVALLESCVHGSLFLLAVGYADVLGEVVKGIIPCVES